MHPHFLARLAPVVRLLALTFLLTEAGCHATAPLPVPPRAATGSALAPALAAALVGPAGRPVADSPAFARTFTHHTAEVAGTRLHYVVGGQGDVVVLLHGWPETWYAWAKVMPGLARHYTVLAVDLPGLGDSAPPANGAYDTQATAALLHALVGQLGYRRVRLVGHDVGTWVAYAYAAQYGPDVQQLVMLEALLPGLSAPASPTKASNTKTWQFAFNSLDDLPEELVQGKERPYLNWLFQHKATQLDSIGPAAIDRYVAAYTPAARLHAGFEYYRAVYADKVNDAAQNQVFARHQLTMPVLAYGGEAALGPALLQNLRGLATDVRGGVVPNCGHFIPEEQPHFLTRQLLAFFAGQLPPAPARPLLATARDVDHVGITVPDLDQAIAFFTQVIGAELLWSKPVMHDPTGHTFPRALQISPRSTARIAMVRCGPGLNVELLEYHAPHQRRSIPANSDVDVSHLCFFVEDMAAAAAYLTAHGCRMLAGPSTNHGLNEGERYQYFLTPWGMSLEILYRPAPLPYERTTRARVYGPAPAWH